MLGRSEVTPFWLAHSCRGPPSPALPASTSHQTGVLSRLALSTVRRGAPCTVSRGVPSIVSRGWHLLHEETVSLHEGTVSLHEKLFHYMRRVCHRDQRPTHCWQRTTVHVLHKGVVRCPPKGSGPWSDTKRLPTVSQGEQHKLSDLLVPLWQPMCSQSCCHTPRSAPPSRFSCMLPQSSQQRCTPL